MKVEVARTDAHILACYPVMRELRPHLEAEAFLRIVKQLQQEGYTLAFLEASGQTERSKGYGKILLEWVKGRALEAGCAELHLDSALHRTDSHRCYERNGVPSSGYRFRAVLEKRVPWRVS